MKDESGNIITVVDFEFLDKAKDVESNCFDLTFRNQDIVNGSTPATMFVNGEPLYPGQRLIIACPSGQSIIGKFKVTFESGNNDSKGYVMRRRAK